MTEYRMSEAGTCLRALVAMKLNYESSRKRTPEDEKRLRYYSRCEALASEQMTDEGLVIDIPDYCSICQSERTSSRHGWHVEIESTLFKLIGHLDRKVLADRLWYPVEIKSLGRFSWSNFNKYRFEKFPEYAAQEACYLHAEDKPGIYWVLNRDTGQYLKFVVNDTRGELGALKGFDKLTLPITYPQIEEMLNLAEIHVAEGTLPEIPYSESTCMYCGFDYLCTKDKEKPVEANEIELIQAASKWCEGKDLERQAEDILEQAKETFLRHAKSKDLKKFTSGRVSVSYLGVRARSYVDEKKLKELVTEDVLSQVYKQGKPWDDIRLRISKED